MGRMDEWAVLDGARPGLLAMFREAGVERIEYVVGFVAPYQVSVWLGTESDAQRDALAERAGLDAAVAEVLRATGIESTDAVFDGVAVQSQESVDRAYQGSWFYALR
jgi:hypothetical protein